MVQICFWGIVLIIGLGYLLDLVLDALNIQHWSPERPSELKDFYSESEYQKAKNYNEIKYRLNIVEQTTNTVLLLALIITGAFGALHGWLAGEIQDPVMRGLAFFGILYLVSDWLNMPFTLYNTFKIEEAYGFNKMTWKTFLADKLKGYLVTALLGGGILALLLWIIQIMSGTFWIYAFVLVAGIGLFFNMFYTKLILPLFNKLTPLEEGSLKTAIQEYAHKVGFPVTDVLVMDGSKRSSKANAFFTGLGNQKKIVLFDTLVNDMEEEEILAILAHEVGHYKKKHIPKNMVLGLFQTALMFFLLSFVVNEPAFSKALGASESVLYLNLLAFTILYEPISTLIGLVMNVLSRKFEFEADAFAAQTADGQALISGLKKLATHHLSQLDPHPAYVFLHYSHPPVIQRIRALNAQ